jgi:acetyl esterase/lipase
MRHDFRPAALLLLAIVAGGCSRFKILNAMVPAAAIQSRDHAYGDSPRQRLDVYRPREAVAGKTRLPIVIFFYGGYWRTGDKAEYRFAAQALTSNGFIAVLPDTRLYPEGIFPTFIEDGAAAVRWAHDHAAEFGGDPTRLFLMGHSSGAHVAALLALDRSYLEAAGVPAASMRGAALLSGPYDFVPGVEDRKVFGIDRDESVAARTQPIRFARADAPPLLLIHGLKDDTVHPRNTARLAAAVRAAGGEVTEITYSRRGHADVALALAYPFRWLAPVTRDCVQFFRAQMDPL